MYFFYCLIVMHFFCLKKEIVSKRETFSKNSERTIIDIRSIEPWQPDASRTLVVSLYRGPKIYTRLSSSSWSRSSISADTVKLEGTRCGMDTTANIADVDMGRMAQRVLPSSILTPYDLVE